MNTSRAVLHCPHSRTQNALFPLSQTCQTLVTSILMLGATPLQSKNVDSYRPQMEILSQRIDETLEKAFTDESQKEITGPDITKMFEGFTPILKLDPEKNTYCIGYGTDIGKKIKHFPYGDNAEDIAEYMRSIGLSDRKIQSLLQGKERIEDELAQKLFDLRYFKRKDILAARYETLCEKKFTDLPAVIQMATIDLSYNMCGDGGIFASPGFPGFPKAREALKNEDWATFAQEIANSKYTDQVGRRAEYWVYQFAQLSEKPLATMSDDVKEEVESYKKIQPEMEERIARILLANR